MNIDLIKFFEQADRVYPFEGQINSGSINDYINEFKIVEPIEYKGAIYKVDGSYLINADIKYKYETHCNRCNDTTRKEINTSLSAKLEEYGKQYEDNEDDEDKDVIHYKRGILNLDEYILMEVASSLPMKTLCDENCKGLCPRCGIDLNKGSCTCQNENIDLRFEKLKDFFLDE